MSTLDAIIRSSPAGYINSLLIYCLSSLEFLPKSFSTALYPKGFSDTILDSTILNLSSSWCDLGCDHIEPGKFNVDNNQLKEMKSIKEFKMANLNINSLLKYIDELREIMVKYPLIYYLLMKRKLTIQCQIVK